MTNYDGFITMTMTPHIILNIKWRCNDARHHWKKWRRHDYLAVSVYDAAPWSIQYFLQNILHLLFLCFFLHIKLIYFSLFCISFTWLICTVVSVSLSLILSVSVSLILSRSFSGTFSLFLWFKVKNLWMTVVSQHCLNECGKRSTPLSPRLHRVLGDRQNWQEKDLVEIHQLYFSLWLVS